MASPPVRRAYRRSGPDGVDARPGVPLPQPASLSAMPDSAEDRSWQAMMKVSRPLQSQKVVAVMSATTTAGCRLMTGNGYGTGSGGSHGPGSVVLPAGMARSGSLGLVRDYVP